MSESFLDENKPFSFNLDAVKNVIFNTELIQ